MLYMSKFTAVIHQTDLTLGNVIDDTTLWKYMGYVTEHTLKL